MPITSPLFSICPTLIHFMPPSNESHEPSLSLSLCISMSLSLYFKVSLPLRILMSLALCILIMFLSLYFNVSLALCISMSLSLCILMCVSFLPCTSVPLPFLLQYFNDCLPLFQDSLGLHFHLASLDQIKRLASSSQSTEPYKSTEVTWTYVTVVL